MSLWVYGSLVKVLFHIPTELKSYHSEFMYQKTLWPLMAMKNYSQQESSSVVNFMILLTRCQWLPIVWIESLKSSRLYIFNRLIQLQKRTIDAIDWLNFYWSFDLTQLLQRLTQSIDFPILGSSWKLPTILEPSLYAAFPN